MKGTAKQIAWAEDIKAAIAIELQVKPGANPLLIKAIETLLSIDNAEFWIDFKEQNGKSLITDMMRGGLFYRGRNFSDCMKMDKDGNVTTFNR